MNITLAYKGHSELTATSTTETLSLAPNLAREPVAFDAPLLKPLRFREAMSALHDVVVSDLRFKKNATRPRIRNTKRTKTKSLLSSAERPSRRPRSKFSHSVQPQSPPISSRNSPNTSNATGNSAWNTPTSCSAPTPPSGACSRPVIPSSPWRTMFAFLNVSQPTNPLTAASPSIAGTALAPPQSSTGHHQRRLLLESLPPLPDAAFLQRDAFQSRSCRIHRCHSCPHWSRRQQRIPRRENRSPAGLAPRIHADPKRHGTTRHFRPRFP